MNASSYMTTSPSLPNKSKTLVTGVSNSSKLDIEVFGAVQY